MSLAAQGAYRNLLDASWENGGKLPNSPDIFWWYAMAKTPRDFAKVSKEVLAMFTVTEDGKWIINETLSSEWSDTSARMADVSKKRSEAGKKGNQKRWSQDGRKCDDSESQVIADNITLHNNTVEDINPSAKADGAVSSLHGQIREFIQQCICYATKLPKAPWTSKDGKYLDRQIKANPSWGFETWRALIQARFRSEVTHGDPPWKWLLEISKYAQGPLDRFGKPIQGGRNGIREDSIVAHNARNFTNADATVSNGASTVRGNDLLVREADGATGNSELAGEPKKLQT